MARFVGKGGMKSYGVDDARQAFPARTLGIMLESSSLLTRFIEGAGDKFDVTVKPLPISADPASVYFPADGSAIVMLATDPAQQAATWRYMRFVTGAEGAKTIVENTGFAPTKAKMIEDATYLADSHA